MDNIDLLYNKMIIFDINHNKSFIKCSIDNNIVSCSNNNIKKDIQSKLTISVSHISVSHVSFYISLHDYGEIKTDKYYDTYKNLLFNELPIYKKDNDLTEFINNINTNNKQVKIYATKRFENINDDYNDPEKCKLNERNIITNYKYNNFTQFIYHAADHSNVSKYGLLYTLGLFNYNEEKKLIKNNINITHNSIINTMYYLFDYMKKGILVGIKSNKLAIFLPFSKIDYENDFYDELYFDENDKKLLSNYKRTKNPDLRKKMENTTRYYFKKLGVRSKDTTFDRTKWYANDCLFRHDTYEGDKNVLLFQDMIVELCKEKQINDCIFFMNVRDFPVLRTDRKHPYTSITNKSIPEKYKQDFCPIFSTASGNAYDDIPLLTPDDWTRVSNKYYPERCINNYIDQKEINIEWKDKKPIAFFRGASSGCGMTFDNNMRLRLIQIAKEYPDLFNVGITSFNKRLKKNLNKNMTIFNEKDLDIKMADFVSNDEKATYKYILNIDGHVSAFRLGHEMSSKSTILLVESHYYIWFSKMLVPYEHYVPVKCDLSNLVEIIEWCKNNDSKCKQISENALKFYNIHLNKEGALNYLQEKLNKIILIKEPTKKPINIAIIACYRDDIEHTRLKQKRMYCYLMNKILTNMNINFKILIVEQNSNNKFNIARLKNIGFDYVNKKENFDNYIFTDIDMIPDEHLIHYFSKITDGFTSLAFKGTRYSTWLGGAKMPFYGGCISCTKETFLKVNGYSNLFTRGWGGEDENLVFRAYLENLTTYIPKQGTIIDIEETSDGKEKDGKIKIQEVKKEDNYDMLKFEMLMKYKLYKEDGLNTLHYIVEYENICNNMIHIIVDLEQEKHEKKYKNQYDVSNFSMEEYDEFSKKKKTFPYKFQEL